MSIVTQAPHQWPDLQPSARAALQLVLRQGPMGRSEMARSLGVSRANLTRVTRDLLAVGLVQEGRTELRASTGRPIELLEPVHDAYQFLGVKLTGEALYAAVVNLANDVVASTELELRSHDPHQVADEIAIILRGFQNDHPRIAGVGVTLAGTISGPPGQEVVYESSYLGWDGVALADLLSTRVGLPVSVANDVQALTLAESIGLQGHSSIVTMALVTVGVGIGVGYVIDGKLVKGANGRPGKLSHLLVDATGPQCDAGHRGCVSSYLTNASIARNAGREAYGEALEAARAGDEPAMRAFQAAGLALGTLLGAVADATDPGLIILTGDGLALHSLAESSIQEGIARAHAWDAGAFTLDVRAFDFSEWARAAAVMAINTALVTVR
ncbi:ROK family protein [Leifsonia sp. NPDC058292]|uniref:ROK family protein n=1 Tax=Leifsonia sp. NPDC058292 TaxID=3346428 RepID=UPI0036DE6364